MTVSGHTIHIKAKTGFRFKSDRSSNHSKSPPNHEVDERITYIMAPAMIFHSADRHST
jgi:hypothetical protein